METLTLDIQDGIALVTLNRPDVLNSINTKLIDEMRETVATIAADRDARVMLMTGAGLGSGSFPISAAPGSCRALSAAPARSALR